MSKWRWIFISLAYLVACTAFAGGKKTEILLLGNYCHDTLILKSGKVQTLGGSVAYMANLLSQLDAKYEVISKVGHDFLYLDQVLRAPLIVENAKTTAFVDDFSGGERRSEVEAVCEPIFSNNIEYNEIEVAMIGGGAGEILPETLSEVSKKAKILLVDAQSLIYQAKSNGDQINSKLQDTPFYDELKRVTFLKVSREEAQWMDLEEVRKRTQVLFTLNGDGFKILDKDHDWETAPHYPGVPAAVKDLTGAGDSFLAGFGYCLWKKYSLEKCARFANWCGAQAVESVGLPKLDPWTLRQELEALKISR